MKFLSQAETLLLRYGIEKPAEIDLEALAWALGARVKYSQLDSCEARIVGIGDKAIITVDDTRVNPQRARYSLGHEIGHWQRHRGEVLFCSKEHIESGGKNVPRKEREADKYCAELIMPKFMFYPMARSFTKLSFAAVDALAEAFKTSRMATAIRYINMDIVPSMIICYGTNGREWFFPSGSWPSNWIPKRELDHDSEAFNFVFGHSMERQHRSVCPASVYFNGADADRFEVWEHSIPTGGRGTANRQALTLLEVKTSSMMDARDHWTDTRY